jgi:hypothetical protein
MSMKCLTRKSFLGLTAIALCVGLTAGTARAALVGTPILPGGTAIPTINLPGTAFVGEVLVASDPINRSLGGLINGNLANAVYRNTSTGFLDFLFQFSNDAASVAVNAITVNNYASVITGVGIIAAGTLPVGTPFVQPTGLTSTPLSVQRGSGLGPDLTFDGVGFSVNPGETSNIFFVTTNATNFNAFGTAQASATNQFFGGTVFSQKFQPSTAAVPEPPVTVMMGLISLAGLGYRQYRKVRVQV